MKKLVFILLFSINAFALEIPPVVISAKVNKAKVTTGDLFTYAVKLDVDKKFSVTLPELGGTIASFRVVEFGKEDPMEEEGRVVSSRWYQLQADLTGSYILPALEVKYKDKDGKEVSAKTSEIFVEVASVLGKDGDAKEVLREIKGLRSSSRSLTSLSYILIAVILLVISLLVLLWFRTKNSKDSPEFVRAPHEIALTDLKEMEAAKLSLKPFYFTLTDIFKRYFEAIYQVPVTDMTIEEIIRNLKKEKDVSNDLKEQFLYVMKESELIKFSDHIPNLENSDDMLKRVRNFVEQTMPNELVDDEQESVI